MRQTMLFFVVVGAVLSGVTFAAGEEEALALEVKQLEFEHTSRLAELDIESKEAQLDVQKQMQELELEKRRAQTQRPQRGSYHHKRRHGRFACLIVLGMIIVRILATIWVCGDLSRRKTGSGLWVPIVLIAGLFGLLVYAVTRIGDMPQTQGNG